VIRSLAVRTAALFALLAFSLAGTACYDGNKNQVPSWEPPTAANERVQRIERKANAKDAGAEPDVEG